MTQNSQLRTLQSFYGFTQNIHDAVNLLVAGHEGRSQAIDIAADPAVEPALAAFLVQPFSHFSRGIECFLRRLVLDELESDQHPHTANITDDAQGQELLHAVE